MPWVKSPDEKYADSFYRLLFSLQGTPDFKAYWELFPSNEMKPKEDYQILNDKTNRGLMVAISQNGNFLNLNDLAKKLSLSPKDVRERLELFKANGLRGDVADKYL